MKLRAIIQACAPRRRRRVWRYVSGRRRRVGMLALLALLLGVYAWWHFTNEPYLRRQAEQYLRELTGTEVSIGQVELSQFDGIRLSNVRVVTPVQGRPLDVFLAQEVWLRHNPLNLLTRGRIRVTAIVCVRPTLVICDEALTAPAASTRGPDGERALPPMPRRLPALEFRNGQVRYLTMKGQDDLLWYDEWSFHAWAWPRGGEPAYDFEIVRPGADGEPPVRDRGSFNVRTRQISLNTAGSIQALARTVPEHIRRWRQRYDLQGRQVLSVQAGAQHTQIVATLQGVSLRLPQEQGDLSVTDVHGTVTFSPAGIEIRPPGLTGRLPQFGQALVRIQGHMHGHDAGAPFEWHLEGEDLLLPLDPAVRGPVAELLSDVHYELAPSGRVHLSATVARSAQGEISWSGQARVDGVVMTARRFPYRLEGVEGLVAFEDGQFELRGFTGRHDEARVDCHGTLALVGHTLIGEIHLSGPYVPLDADLRAALPREAQAAWDELAPRGGAGIQARVFRTGAERGWDVETAVQFDGRAAGRYQAFPYALEELRGQLRIANNQVAIRGLTGRQGKASVTIDGLVAGIDDHEGLAVDLTLQAAGVALDERLSAALPLAARRHYQSFAPAGQVDIAGRLGWRRGRELDYELTATLRGAALTAEAFPYPLTKVDGVVHFTPQRTVVERLVGQAAQGRVVAAARLRHDAQAPALELSVDADNLALDRTLYLALPKPVADVWDRLQPAGTADIHLELRTPAEADQPLEYLLRLVPQQMSVTYRGFPYPLRNLRGTITAQPGRVTLTDISAGPAKTPVRLGGTISTGSDGGQAELTLTARRLPLDEALLSAVPEELGAFTRHLRPGGTCDLELRRLRYTWTAAAPGTGTAAASRPEAPGQWSLAGRLAVHDVRLGESLGQRQVAGAIEGTLSCDDHGGNLAVDAALELDRVEFEGRLAERIRGRIRKSADRSTLRVDDLTARLHGGRLAGQAELAVEQPARYALRLMVEKVDLDELLAAETARRAEPSGQLAGTLELSGTIGQPDSRMATGRIEITQARLYRLPVLLDVLNVLLLQLPDDPAFDQATVSYYLKGNTLNFEEIYLAGVSTAWLGRGSVDMRRQTLDLTFLSGPPKKVPPVIRLAKELLSNTTRGLLEVRIGGTIRNPVTRTVPLGSLDNLLREMFASQ